MTPETFARLIESAMFHVIDNGPVSPAYEELSEVLANGTPTNDGEGVVFELEDGSSFIVRVEKVEG